MKFSRFPTICYVINQLTLLPQELLVVGPSVYAGDVVVSDDGRNIHAARCYPTLYRACTAAQERVEEQMVALRGREAALDQRRDAIAQIWRAAAEDTKSPAAVA